MHQGANTTNKYDANLGRYAIAFAIALVALLPRLDGLKYFPGMYLWAEDGTIFLNQAQEMGWAAVKLPYAGYIHFFPRIVTAISQLFSLAYQPTILLLGWLVAYLTMMYAVIGTAIRSSRSIVAVGVLVALVSLQPNHGEVFFTITNSQWMIGAALFIFALVETEGSELHKKAKGAFLLPLALTGPFSIILSPLLLARVLLKKDWAGQKYIYLSVFCGALIQTGVLLTSPRVDSGPISKSLGGWIGTFLKLAIFGADTVPTILVALAFWAIIAFLAYTILRGRKLADKLMHPAILLLGAAALMLLAGMYTQKNNPGILVAMGVGNRYTWVPFVLILLSAFLLANGRKMLGAGIALLFLVICMSRFHQVGSPDLQFQAFAKLAQVQPVVIPINPQWPQYPGWHLMGQPKNGTAPPLAVSKLGLENVATGGLTSEYAGEQLFITSTGNDPTVTFTRKQTCPNSKFAALNIQLTREKEGWMQLFWDENGGFAETSSLRRWYPAGAVMAQFAFPMPASGIVLRFDPQEIEGPATIQKVELYCL